MDTTKCITDQQWERYARKQLLAAEERQLLQHVASCEICTDIKEGIDAMANASQLPSINARLHEQINTRLRSEPKRAIPIFYWLSAAVLFLVATFGMLRYSKEVEQQQVQNLPSVQTDTPQVIKEDKTIVLVDKPKVTKRKPVLKPAKPIEIVASTQVQSDAVMPIPETMETEKGEADDAKLPEVASEQVSVESKAEVSKALSVAVSKPESVEQKRKKTKQTRNLSLPSNKAASNNNNYEPYSNDLNKYELPIAYNAQLDSIQIVRAFSLLERGEADSALVEINPLLFDPKGAWFEDAKYLEALITYRKGEKRKAEYLMKQVLARNGKRQAEAILQLKKWEEK